MNHVIADNVTIGAYLYFDAVVASRACASQVVNVISLDETVGNPASIIVASQIHAFACSRATRIQARVMDVISSQNHGIRVSTI
jgi:hypothetical protein